MKKLILAVSLMAMSSPSFAKSDFMEYLKTYGIPCAASLAAGALLVEDDGLKVGLVGCAATSATVYVIEESRKKKPLSDADKKLLEEQIQSSVRSEVTKLQNSFKSAIEKSLSEALEKNATEIAKDLDMKSSETRELMREVIASQLIEMKESMREELFKKVEEGKFMPELKKNIKAESQKAAKDVFESNKKEVIEKAVEGTIKQVIKQEVGVSEDDL